MLNQCCHTLALQVSATVFGHVVANVGRLTQFWNSHAWTFNEMSRKPLNAVGDWLALLCRLGRHTRNGTVSEHVAGSGGLKTPHGLRCSKIRLLERAVSPALFWCAGSWNLRADQVTSLRALQSSLVRKMLSFSRLSGEDLASPMQRSNSIIKHMLKSHHIDRWDVVAHKLVFKWGGWVARLANHDLSRLTLSILRYKDWTYISGIADANNGNQLHGRILRTWRWERPLYKFRQDWQVFARDQNAWLSSLTQFSCWRQMNRSSSDVFFSIIFFSNNPGLALTELL